MFIWGTSSWQGRERSHMKLDLANKLSFPGTRSNFFSNSLTESDLCRGALFWCIIHLLRNNFGSHEETIFSRTPKLGNNIFGSQSDQMRQTSVHYITTASLLRSFMTRLWTPFYKSSTAASLWGHQHLLILWSSVEWLAPVMAVCADCLSQGVTGLVRKGNGNILMLDELLWWLNSHYLLFYYCYT